MGSRLELHAILKTITDIENVYFQPPASYKMLYPCIVYNLDTTDILHANNSPYRFSKRYSVTIIDSDPDSVIPQKLASRSLCSHQRNYVEDNLNHFVYNLYF